MKLALEVPASHLSLTSFADLDFALAHKVLEDERYAEFFRSRSISRELILDNSMHELGESVSVADLVRAAQLCHANYVIPPDRLEDARWTLEKYEEAKEAFSKSPALVAGVLCGNDARERDSAMEILYSAPMLCLPYKKPRIDWWAELPPVKPWKRIHLLGLSSLNELRWWLHEEKQTRGVEFSIDTTKPIRWGIQNRKIDDGESLRGGALNAKQLLDVAELTAEQRISIRYNILYLRQVIS